MQGTRRKIDWDSPEIKAFRREVQEATFTKEGMMVAFPTCFPGMTLPIVPDECHITALDATPAGVIYGGTSGYRTHLFAAKFHELTGIVFDLGVIPTATECVAVCCGKTRFAAFVNGAKGGRAIVGPVSELTEDLIQEWGFDRPTLEDVGECSPGEPVVHAVAEPSGTVVGATSRHVFRLDPGLHRIEVVGEATSGGRIAVTSKGNIVGRDGDRTLWQFDPRTSVLRRGAINLPGGAWNHPLFWARDPRSGLLYTADQSGRLFSYDEAAGFSGPLGQAPLSPAGPMAVTFDGRVFGFCGAEMAKIFSLDPERRRTTNLGGAASVLERRRYGYVFGDAVTGRDGEIIFGEDDNGGHLWLYFPRIVARA